MFVGHYWPNGIGPSCSATGPSTAAGRNSSAPTRTIVPSSTKANVSVSVRLVPVVDGVGFFAARLPASASGAMIGTNRQINMTSPQAMSQCGAYGAGGDGFAFESLKPQVSPSPSNPEPLFALAEVNS